MRLPNAAHTDLPWRIHDIAGDFRLEDVWAIHTPGAGPDDFPAMVAAIGEAGMPPNLPAPIRLLFWARAVLGALLGWDKPETGLGERVRSLRDRLPSDLREAPRGADSEDVPFAPVYQLHDECARESADKVVHTIMHLGWVPTAGGGYELRLAVLVKPNGLFGRLFMVAIAPFRHLVVYPALTRLWERVWRTRGGRESVDSVVGTRHVPASVRGVSSLSDADYADLFTVTTDAEATPEQWARAMFGDEPGVAGLLIWRGFLGLRLSRRRSPDTVAGWQVAEHGEHWIRLEAASWFLTGNLIVLATGGRVSLATFVRYEGKFGRVVWTPLSAVHRRLIPGLLRRTTRRVMGSGLSTMD